MSDLKSFIERVKNLVAEKIGLDEDIKEVLDEADEAGFDKAIIRKVATIAAKQSALKIAKERAKLDEYAAQIGLDFDMPSGIPGGKKDHGRAAPRAAGNGAGEPHVPASAEETRPVANQASPDLTDPERHQRLIAAGFIHLGGNEYEAPGKSADEPPDIPPFLDRRAKSGQADGEDYTGAAAE